MACAAADDRARSTAPLSTKSAVIWTALKRRGRSVGASSMGATPNCHAIAMRPPRRTRHRSSVLRDKVVGSFATKLRTTNCPADAGADLGLNRLDRRPTTRGSVRQPRQRHGSIECRRMLADSITSPFAQSSGCPVRQEWRHRRAGLLRVILAQQACHCALRRTLCAYYDCSCFHCVLKLFVLFAARSYAQLRAISLEHRERM